MAERATIAFRAAAAVDRALPERMADAVARVASRAFCRADGARRAQVERNLRRVYGEAMADDALHDAVRATFESYGRYWAESFRLPGTSAAERDARMYLEGAEHLDAAIEQHRGVIFALPHLGGWEWGGFWIAAVRKHQLSVVVEPLEPPSLFEWFKSLREQLGMHVIALGPDAGSEVVRALKADHIVCLLCDRAIGDGGVETELFGERTLLPAGPATLALRTGAPLLPCAVYFDGRSHHGLVRPALTVERQGRLREDVARITQDLARELEVLIRRAPDQWHLLQPNWPTDPGYRA